MKGPLSEKHLDLFFAEISFTQLNKFTQSWLLNLDFCIQIAGLRWGVGIKKSVEVE